MTGKCALLDETVRAHGGIEKWHAVRELIISATTGGVALPLRFQPSAFKSYKAQISTREFKTVIVPHPGKGKQGTFEGNTVRINSQDGQLIAERSNPRQFFKKLRRKIFWDNLDVLYFGGYALWNYLNFPYLLLRPDIAIKEIEPWIEGEEKLRRLHALFPEEFPTHSTEQVFYFNSDGLLVRHDYTAEVFGQWAKAAHYTMEHKEFGGLIFPTKRRVFPRQRSGHPLRMLTLVSIDIDDVNVV